MISSEDAYFFLYLQSNDKEEVPISAGSWQERSDALGEWLSRDSGFANNGQQYLRVILEEIRKDSVCDLNTPIDTKISELERCLSMVEELPPRVKNIVARRTAWWHGSIADQLYLYFDSSQDVLDIDETKLYIDRAQLKCQKSIDVYQAQGEVGCTDLRQRLAAELCVVRIYWLQKQRKGEGLEEIELEQIRKSGLQNLERAEEFFASKRQESTWNRNLEGLEQRERATSLEGGWKIPVIAMQLLAAGNSKPNESRRIEMWKWVQRAEARSLATSMGQEGVIPETLLKDILASEKCRPIYERMVSLQNQIVSAESHRRYALRHELDLHLDEMKRDQLLREVCDLKDGMPLTLADVERITLVAHTPLVLVDWYVVPDLFGDGTLLLLTARSGRVPTVTTLDIRTIEPIDWVATYLDSSMSQQRSKDTGNLNALVQPLLDLSEPGDILVFCPSAALHRIPLHAIETLNNDASSWQPIIYRNPIFYSHSHSLLRVCLWNTQLAFEAKDSFQPLVMNGIPENANFAKYTAGRDSIKRVANWFDTIASFDESATRPHFIECASSSRLVHIHSHVWWDASDPLGHYIDLNHDKLKAREIFTIPFPKGTHVNLIACLGGRARIGYGDEVMGLVPALLHSGASSTVSTLWSIPDTIGARFTDAFFKDFFERRRDLHGGHGGFINLALVFQSAVKELATLEEKAAEKELMLHWSSFVPHGFWDFFIPETQVESEASVILDEARNQLIGTTECKARLEA